jgi:hypothetical protein
MRRAAGVHVGADGSKRVNPAGLLIATTTVIAVTIHNVGERRKRSSRGGRGGTPAINKSGYVNGTPKLLCCAWNVAGKGEEAHFRSA